jgi:hypothetical protein
MIAVVLISIGVLIPFLVGIFIGYNGESPVDTRYQPSDNENVKTALLKEQVNILDKNRRESWTNPNYFKK